LLTDLLSCKLTGSCHIAQVETGSAITWKYPSVVLKGDNSVGEFYSVALTNQKQQADTGTKMIHVGKNTRSRIVSKGISAGFSRNAYRGLVQVCHMFCSYGVDGLSHVSRIEALLIFICGCSTPSHPIRSKTICLTVPTVAAWVLLSMLMRSFCCWQVDGQSRVHDTDREG
jgi:SUF system FeS cluster assembly, SufBD